LLSTFLCSFSEWRADILSIIFYPNSNEHLHHLLDTLGTRQRKIKPDSFVSSFNYCYSIFRRCFDYWCLHRPASLPVLVFSCNCNSLHTFYRDNTVALLIWQYHKRITICWNNVTCIYH
jgi:hypothetical protein